jgi:hypothetical protein
MPWRCKKGGGSHPPAPVAFKLTPARHVAKCSQTALMQQMIENDPDRLAVSIRPIGAGVMVDGCTGPARSNSCRVLPSGCKLRSSMLTAMSIRAVTRLSRLYAAPS